MNAVRYKYILGGVKDLIGLASVETITQRNLIRGLVSRRLSYIWGNTAWPSITKWEERAVTDDAVNGDYVPLTEAGKDSIDAVFAVRDKNPLVNIDSVNLEWALNHLGVTVPDGYSDLWLYYRKTRPRLVGDAYSATTSYSIGDQVYDPTEGDFFNCVAASTGDAVTDTNFWERVEIPVEFEEFLVNGAFADYLRNDGQEDKSVRVAEAPAQKALKHALYVLKQSQGQQTRPRVNTY